MVDHELYGTSVSKKMSAHDVFGDLELVVGESCGASARVSSEIS